jgi:PAS domain S-box-containing protein
MSGPGHRPSRRAASVMSTPFAGPGTADGGELVRHFRLALEAGGLGTWRWDMATGVTVWDERLEALFGLAPGTFEGTYEAWLARQHPDDVDRVVATVDAAVRDRCGYVMDHRVVWPDGTVRWLQGRGQVVLDAAGEVLGTIGCVADVTDRVRFDQERERRMAEAGEAIRRERLHRTRLELLGRVNDALRAATDRGDLMRRVTQAVVPRLGDWCALYLLTDAGPVPEVEIAHVDPEMVALGRDLQRRFPYDPHAPQGVPSVIRTGRTERELDIDDDVIDRADLPAEARDILRSLALRSSIIVPLVKRGRVLGAMQFVMSRSNRSFDEDDVTLAEAVAVRIASSLENLRLVEQQRQIALTLQRDLLPSVLPDIPGVDLAVRYWAAGEGTEVGGDFYDVFPIEPGRWGLAIGDVCGTGPSAASLTALARHSIRSAAWHGDDPATVLAHLNRALAASDQGSFVTAVYGEWHDGHRRLELAVAGHPLPVLIEADGRARMVGRPGTLLGPFPRPRVHTTPVDLAAGATLVLYTDGVSDVPPPAGLDDAATVDLVRDAVAGALDAEHVADRIHARLSARLPVEARPDDIALLVVRLPTG